MTTVVTGASGLIGRALTPVLAAAGERVIRLVRRAPRGGDEGAWDPAAGRLDPAVLAGAEAVVHLSGENVASGRWTAARMAALRESRVGSTRLLAGTLAGLSRPPRVLVCASGINAYGDRGDEVLTEASPLGQGFLPDLCRAWEAAADPARRAGVRVVHLRLGVVLDRAGGALPRLLLPFRLGVGGVVGPGTQWMSWISLDDAVAAIRHALAHEALAGPVNTASPGPVTNAELTRTLGRLLRRPTLLPLPAFAARLALGRMADELLLASTRAMPARLLETGFTFRHPELPGALRHALGRPAPTGGGGGTLPGGPSDKGDISP